MAAGREGSFVEELSAGWSGDTCRWMSVSSCRVAVNPVLTGVANSETLVSDKFLQLRHRLDKHIAPRAACYPSITQLAERSGDGLAADSHFTGKVLLTANIGNAVITGSSHDERADPGN